MLRRLSSDRITTRTDLHIFLSVNLTKTQLYPPQLRQALLVLVRMHLVRLCLVRLRLVRLYLVQLSNWKLSISEWPKLSSSWLLAHSIASSVTSHMYCYNCNLKIAIFKFLLPRSLFKMLTERTDGTKCNIWAQRGCVINL
jgi:hypothetical protein